MSSSKPISQAELEILQHQTFRYFLHETNSDNGLVKDKTAADWPASIAATGFALASYPIAVERGFMPRSAAVERTLVTLRFFWNSVQGSESDATGYHGFYYHFLDMRTGQRAWKSELSIVDSAFLLAGALTAGIYFDADTADELEIRTLSDSIYRRADWQWAQNHGALVTHGWKPESGFLKYRWEAAKILAAIGDYKAIPSLVKTLEDRDHDVAWVDAVALKKLKKAAWPDLLRVLIKRKSHSVFCARERTMFFGTKKKKDLTICSQP